MASVSIFRKILLEEAMYYNKQERRYDLDWLRTFAFGVLILYHIGMYYVADWGWHIKSSNTSVVLQDIMLLTNTWRMSLLFFISAIALAFVQQRYSSWLLVNVKSVRLLLPLLFGMFVIVAPQAYYEALSQQLIEPGFINFWLDYINPSTDLLTEHHSMIGLLTWNHLWFLPYLWCYSLIFIVFRKPIVHFAKSFFIRKLPTTLALVFIVLSLTFVWLALRQKFPSTHALVDDWYNHGKYFLVFFVGYMFALQKSWWQFVIDKRRIFLVLALLGYAFIVADRHNAFELLASQFETNSSVRFFYGIVLSINHWAWIFCVVGFAGYWLNKPSKTLSYATEAILPWYLLHQTLIIVFAWWLKPLMLPPQIEVLFLIVMTTTGCLIGYEVIKRISVLRFLSGLKLIKRSTPHLTQFKQRTSE
jgi:hypothetical protein